MIALGQVYPLWTFLKSASDARDKLEGGSAGTIEKLHDYKASKTPGWVWIIFGSRNKGEVSL